MKVEIKGHKFLVTGGAGFIGSYVVKKLLASQAAKVTIFDKVINHDLLPNDSKLEVIEGDLTKLDAVRKAAAGVDGIFHMAVLPLGPSSQNPRLALDVNVLGTFNVIEAAKENQVKKIVFSSASSVYGDTVDTMDETHPLNANTFYGATKICCEALLRAAYFEWRLPFVALRYMNVYGPAQTAGLIANVIKKLKASEAPEINGDGSASFDFVFVDDVALANIKAMEAEAENDFFNVGSGEEKTVKEIVGELIKISGQKIEPKYNFEGKVPMFRRVGSSKKAAEKINFKVTIDLANGLRKVYEAK